MEKTKRKPTTASKKPIVAEMTKTTVAKRIPAKARAVSKVVSSSKKTVAKTTKSTKTIPVTERKGTIKTKVQPDNEPLNKFLVSKLKVDERTDPETITLVTGTISLRLKEKTEAYRRWFFYAPQSPLKKVTLTFAYAFLLFGTLASSFFMVPSDLQHRLLGQTICALDNCLSTTSNHASTTTLLLPNVQFTNSPSYHEVKPIEFTVSVSNILEQTGKLYSVDTGHAVSLSSGKRTEDGKVTFTTSADSLRPGTYRFSVYVLGMDSKTRSEFTGPSLVVPSAREVIDMTLTNSSATTNSVGDSVTETVQTSEVIRDTDQATTEIKQVEIVNDDTEIPLEDAITVPGSDLPTDTSTTSVKSQTPALSESEPITVKLEAGVYETQFKILMGTTDVYSGVELYVRAENSTRNQFLGTASRLREGWLYWLDTSSLPVGHYEIVVRGLMNQQVKHTKVFKFENKANLSEYKEAPDYLIEKEVAKARIEKLATTTTVVNLPRITVPPMPIPNYLDNYGTSTEVAMDSEVSLVMKDKAEALLRDNSELFNEKFSRYASAIQSGDKNLARMTEEALNDDVHRILADKVVDSDFEDSLYDIKIELSARLNEIKEKVSKVETFKKERTDEASSQDTDKDGISDYDEYLIYGTDPKSADTDQDGILDGIEIAQGYDPLDAKPEAVISYNSPKDISYVDDTILSVKTVAPLLVYEEESSAPLIQSEISGYGLPNSYVTLFIFSTPIVVTIKTKDDGSYSYTFTKELEDGEHEVYAALTDNKGQIVVRSNPFTFTKTAEAFTRTSDVSEATPLTTSDSPTDSSRIYNIIVAMGILSFGLILLLLAQTLRKEIVKNSQEKLV